MVAPKSMRSVWYIVHQDKIAEPASPQTADSALSLGMRCIMVQIPERESGSGILPGHVVTIETQSLRDGKWMYSIRGEHPQGIHNKRAACSAAALQPEAATARLGSTDSADPELQAAIQASLADMGNVEKSEAAVGDEMETDKEKDTRQLYRVRVGTTSAHPPTRDWKVAKDGTAPAPTLEHIQMPASCIKLAASMPNRLDWVPRRTPSQVTLLRCP